MQFSTTFGDLHFLVSEAKGLDVETLIEKRGKPKARLIPIEELSQSGNFKINFKKDHNSERINKLFDDILSCNDILSFEAVPDLINVFEIPTCLNVETRKGKFIKKLIVDYSTRYEPYCARVFVLLIRVLQPTSVHLINKNYFIESETINIRVSFYNNLSYIYDSDDKVLFLINITQSSVEKIID